MKACKRIMEILTMFLLATISSIDAYGCVTAFFDAESIDDRSCSKITVSPPSLPSGAVDSVYSLTLTATGGMEPYSFSVYNTLLPSGISLSSDGIISGIPDTEGLYKFMVMATDKSGICNGIQTYSLTINHASCPSILISPSFLPNGTVEETYSQNVSASGGNSFFSYVISRGFLPFGLSLTTEGHLEGTPSDAGTFIFTITATDADSCADSQSYSLIVSPVSCPTIVLSSSHFPNGRVDDGYSVDITASGGSSPYLFALTGGSLPPGLDLSSGGWIQGTPSAEGIFDFVITATDTEGCSGTLTCSMQITPAVPPPIITSVIKKTDPFRLKLHGSNFHPDVFVFLWNNGCLYPWYNFSFKNQHLIILKGGSALKAQFPKSVPVAIMIVNGDGGMAETTYTR
ncbi:MAG TPA: Ig domain-containing protein [Acidobacteriota bacterium]|nr:Ig domain-containing protein [Acidobacteriota bacterium]HNT18116.1 Ig domain-containing protein [Acidobacteriota bacterium]HQQ46111.1 Ig domain-containing protein [Acidobacteriota bacterium]